MCLREGVREIEAIREGYHERCVSISFRPLPTALTISPNYGTSGTPLAPY